MVDENEKQTLFNAVSTLKMAIGSTNSLQVIHSTKIWDAYFIWNPPVNRDAIHEIELKISKPIPSDFVEFLIQISDGATLYYDKQYGQWGYKIYGSQEIVAKQKEWKELFKDKWKPNFIAIGESKDDAHPYICAWDDYVNGVNYNLIEGDLLDPIIYWQKIDNNFHNWINHLIIAQGAKYWDWFRK